MTVIALYGLQGGVGTTSITAGLAWALTQLGERVLAVDLSPDNMLRLNFNMPFEQSRGWARAILDNVPWQQSAMRYAPNLDFLPFGQLSADEQIHWTQTRRLQPNYWLDYLAELKASSGYQWILFDLPSGYPSFESALLNTTDINIGLLTPNANNHVRLHQQSVPPNSHLLINKFSANSALQQDIHLIWTRMIEALIPLTLHQDEAIAEASMLKKPIGEYAADSLVAGEILTLANWCLIQSKRQTS